MTPRPNPSLVAFIGPSLDAREAVALSKGVVLPPARQGDVWRALALRPKAIALIDGVFESQPSVWHREIISALGSGVAVFGASSMGALRAAELGPWGMVGIGQVYEWVASGDVLDDSDVALLHAQADHDFRALTVPLVNVRYALEQAERGGILRRPQARVLLSVAKATFYQERTWPRLREAMRKLWDAKTQARWDAFAAPGLPDVKREDARACLWAARAFVDGNATAMSPLAHRLRPSSAVRRRRILDGTSQRNGRSQPSAQLLEGLRQRPDAHQLLRAGLTRSVLAAVARAQGVKAPLEDCERVRSEWLERLGGSEDVLTQLGMDEDEAQRLVEEVVLEEQLLRLAARMIPDAPSDEEALAQEARLRGVWRHPGKTR